LLSRDFVRLGKWYVQPFDGPERPLQKSSHLSFTLHYFVHGESIVCASVDVRQHPAVRRLSMQHLNTARSVHALEADFKTLNFACSLPI
jgi:mediator of RNA polymerase II transcription subunit 13